MRARHLLIALLAAGLIAGCDDDSTGPDGGTGRLVVHLADAPFPFDMIDSTAVTIEMVRVHVETDGAGSGFHVVDDSTRVVDLLAFQNGVTDSIGAIELPTGRIDQIRVHTGEATIYLTDGRMFDLTFPSGGSSGVKVFPSPPIAIEAGETVDVLLDFDLTQSFQAIPASPNHVADIRGFHFHPVVRAVNLAGIGSIAGVVWNAGDPGEPGDDVPLPDAAVTAYRDTVEVTSTMSGADGAYMLMGLGPDTYRVIGTATGFQPDTTEVVVGPGQAVTGQDLYLVPGGGDVSGD